MARASRQPAVATRVTMALPTRPSSVFPAPDPIAKPIAVRPTSVPPRAPTTAPTAPMPTRTPVASTPPSRVLTPTPAAGRPVVAPPQPGSEVFTPRPAATPAETMAAFQASKLAAGKGGVVAPVAPMPSNVVPIRPVPATPPPPAPATVEPVKQPPVAVDPSLQCSRSEVWSPAEGRCVAWVQSTQAPPSSIAPSSVAPSAGGGTAAGGSAGSVSVNVPQAQMQPMYAQGPLPAQGAPTPKKSRTWLWVGLGVVGVVAVGGVTYAVMRKR